MKPTRPVIDLSQLPGTAFGSRTLLWWGTMGIIAIEATVFAMAIVTYFYLRGQVPDWPPAGTPLPDLTLGAVNTLLLLASLVPNEWVKKAAERLDLRTVRVGLLVCIAFAFAFLVVRAFELAAFGTRWDENAYGSIVWTLLGLHTAHLLTDFIDTIILTAMVFQGEVEPKRYADVSDNAFYWYFVVISWLPIWAVLYLVPRVL